MPKATGFKAVSFSCGQKLCNEPDYLWLNESDFDDNLNENQNYDINIMEFVRRAARILSLKFGKKYSRDTAIHSNTLAQCVWFLYYTELCNIIPTRIVARNVKEQFMNKRILIPLSKSKLTALQEWEQACDLLPLYRYQELEKQGLCPIFVMPNEPVMEEISLVINDKIISSTVFLVGDKLFIPKAVRGAQKIVESLIKENSSTTNVKRFNFTGSQIQQTKTSIKFSKAQKNDSESLSSLFISTEPQHIYQKAFTLNLLNFLSVADNLVKQIIQKFQIKQANICDHLFVDTALFAGSVRDINGLVRLWPHSMTTILSMHLNILPNEINRVCEDKHSEKIANAGVKVTLRPDLMLPRPGSFQRLEPNSKINVILIAGAHKLNQAPVFPLKDHKETIRTFIVGLNDRRRNINLFIKPKGGWETFSFFQELTSIKLNETSKSPSQLIYHNMVFVCINQSSAAIIEGVSCGIPGLIVKETKTLDYLELDRQCFPQNSVEATLDILDSFNDHKNLEAAWKMQRTWFDQYEKYY